MTAPRQSTPTIHYERSELIRCLAENIAEEHQTATGTDLSSVLKDAELELIADTFPEPFDGLLIKDKIGYRVICNLSTGNTPASARGRFTIAHELGHYFIDEHRSILEKCLMPSLGERAIRDNVMEREADLFASRLLLPTKFVRDAFKKSKPGLAGICELSKKFKVSIKCAALRYLSEEPMPCSLVFRSNEGCIKWKQFSKQMWNAGFRAIVAEPVKKGATDLCLKGKDTEWTSAPASYLFRLPDQCHANVVFIEESIQLGKFGVLTLYRSQELKLQSMAEVYDKRWTR